MPKSKKDPIQGPLILAIPKNDKKNRSSLLPSSNVPDDGFFGNSNRNSILEPSEEAIENHDEFLFQGGLLGQKKSYIAIPKGNGPLISAIPSSKDLPKPVNTVDHGLVGQMQSRENFMRQSKVTTNESSNRSSKFLNIAPTSHSGLNAEYVYLGRGSYSENGHVNFTPPLDARYSANPNAFMSMEYQAFMYQQYMHALQSQKKVKSKKSSRKKKGKRGKEGKEKIQLPESIVWPYFMPHPSQIMPDMQINNPPVFTKEAQSLPIDSSEESDESEESVK